MYDHLAVIKYHTDKCNLSELVRKVSIKDTVLDEVTMQMVVEEQKFKKQNKKPTDLYLKLQQMFENNELLALLSWAFLMYSKLSVIISWRNYKMSLPDDECPKKTKESFSIR